MASDVLRVGEEVIFGDVLFTVAEMRGDRVELRAMVTVTRTRVLPDGTIEETDELLRNEVFAVHVRRSEIERHGDGTWRVRRHPRPGRCVLHNNAGFAPRGRRTPAARACVVGTRRVVRVRGPWRPGRRKG